MVGGLQVAEQRGRAGAATVVGVYSAVRPGAGGPATLAGEPSAVDAHLPIVTWWLVPTVKVTRPGGVAGETTPTAIECRETS